MNPSTTALFKPVVLTPEQIEHYREDGYLLLAAVLTPQGLEAMLAEFMAAWKREKG